MKYRSLPRTLIKWPAAALLLALIVVYVVSGWYRVSFVAQGGTSLWFKEGLCVFGYHKVPYIGDVGAHVSEHPYTASFESRFYFLPDWPRWYAAIPIWLPLALVLAVVAVTWMPDFVVFRRHGLQESPRARLAFRWMGLTSCGALLILALVSIWMPLHWTDSKGKTIGIGRGSLWIGILGTGKVGALIRSRRKRVRYCQECRGSGKRFSGPRRLLLRRHHRFSWDRHAGWDSGAAAAMRGRLLCRCGC